MKVLRAIRAVAILAVALPVAIVAGLFLSKGRKCTPEELAADLDEFASGTEGEMAWDRLESVPILDPRLEGIRREAMAVNLPLRAEDRDLLGRLAVKARAFQTKI
jgi:hypothetical protein